RPAATASSAGHDGRRVLHEDYGGTTTVVRATVLRAAECPDPLAEEGQYTLRYAIRPDAGVAEAIDMGEGLNQAARTLERGEELAPLASLAEGSSARIQTLKLAEDRSGDVI